jgi:ATP phosphoribosyltransferase regulatory subunit
MSQTPFLHPALLPTGFRDVLPPEAELEARSVATIMDCFAAHGYQLVNPPIVEFEESLFAGSGAAIADQIFRLMDPDSQRMMGLRADTTPQIARLATTRLAAVPRPLRLAYTGPCLRVRGSNLTPDRQVNQAGIELIGHDTAAGDAEIILTAADALAAVGLPDISFDLTVPRLVPHLLESAEIADPLSLTRALDRKDHAAVAQFGGEIAGTLLALLDACGPTERALPKLLAIDLPPIAKAHAMRIQETFAAIRAVRAGLLVTVDPVEFRSYRYHTGICVTVFAPGGHAELGRGGRYLCGDTEPATGITLYPDTIVQVAPPPRLRPRVFLPFGTPPQTASACRAEGFATVAGLSAQTAPAEEAARLRCSHIIKNGVITRIVEDGQ